MVPHRVNVFALPVSVPNRMIRRHLFTPEVLEAWRSWYGIDPDGVRVAPAPPGGEDPAPGGR